jgi:putative spermidine/putrescine transport system substrate-binding protein
MGRKVAKKYLSWVGILIAFSLILPFTMAWGQTKEIVVCNFGGKSQESLQKVFFDPFEKETGIKVIGTSPPRLPKLKSMVESGNLEWDVVVLLDSWVVRAKTEGLLEKMDFSIVNAKDLYPDTVDPYGVGLYYFITGLAYNKKSFPSGNHPKTWADFWDAKKFPGPRGMYKGAMEVFEFALMADGVPKDKLYPLDVDRAFKSLDKIKPIVTVWWATGEVPGQVLAKGEVLASSAWLNRIISMEEEGAPVAAEINQSILRVDFWSVPKGTKNKDAAMKFINYVIQPERQAALSKLMPYAPCNKKALDFMAPDLKKRLFTSPENMGKMVVFNPKGRDWWGEHESEVLERFNQWLLK